MAEWVDTPAQRHERIADVEKATEERMHVTADMLHEPARSRMHGRADAISRRAEKHQQTAERLRRSPDESGRDNL
jgi:hypothetical protein